jgi:hypothetical protein
MSGHRNVEGSTPSAQATCALPSPSTIMRRATPRIIAAIVQWHRAPLAIITDQHRIGESEPLDAVRDLPNLLLGMRARVAIIRRRAVTETYSRAA